LTNVVMITRTVADSGAWTPSALRVHHWREAIRDAVTDTYPQAPFTSPPLGTKFTVEVIFRLTPRIWLDRPRPRQLRQGCPRHTLHLAERLETHRRASPRVNDTWVFRLLLEKVEVKTPQEQGADITVTWHPSVTPDLSTS
jgi:hypothetical protein